MTGLNTRDLLSNEGQKQKDIMSMLSWDDKKLQGWLVGFLTYGYTDTISVLETGGRSDIGTGQFLGEFFNNKETESRELSNQLLQRIKKQIPILIQNFDVKESSEIKHYVDHKIIINYTYFFELVSLAFWTDTVEAQDSLMDKLKSGEYMGKLFEIWDKKYMPVPDLHLGMYLHASIIPDIDKIQDVLERDISNPLYTAAAYNRLCRLDIRNSATYLKQFITVRLQRPYYNNWSNAIKDIAGKIDGMAEFLLTKMENQEFAAEFNSDDIGQIRKTLQEVMDDNNESKIQEIQQGTSDAAVSTLQDTTEANAAKTRIQQMPIMQEISPLVLEAELLKANFVRKTNHGENEIYTFSGSDCPNLMTQVAILREISFRNAGGGTGLSIDLDGFDEFLGLDDCEDTQKYISSTGFHQLIVWNPEDKEIIGGYRYAPMTVFAEKKGATAELFDSSEEFSKKYVPRSIELGRSFVQPKYQNGVGGRRCMYALDNLFDGLGSLVVDHKDMKYFFGKITMYPDYNHQARNMIVYYLEKHFADKDHLVYPKEHLLPDGLEKGVEEFKSIFTGATYQEDMIILKKSIKGMNQRIPPLLKEYPEMSPQMKYFGTAVNHHCGDVEEIAIIIKFDEIVDKYRENYISNYQRYLESKEK